MKKADTKSAVSSLLMDLISIPSVNPAFCSDDALNGEERVADMLAQRGAKLGLDFKYQLVKGKR
ncbi:MAG: M20 family peptidase, partial [Verrucomicrobiota bacterium]|nr:M20 family peptidase [Verrucomicrobiota bacterium]